MRDTSLPLAGPDELESDEDGAREKRLACLVEDHFDFVWRVLRRMGSAPADADDAVQEVFVIATRKLQEIKPGSERTFLYGTARRVAANARRTLRRSPIVAGAPEDLPTTEGGPAHLTELSLAVSLLDRVLERIPVELGRVLVLAEIEQFEVAEIARLEQLKVGTAASRLRRAREAFRRALDEIGEVNPFAREKEQR